jgi:hypothetical protein
MCDNPRSRLLNLRRYGVQSLVAGYDLFRLFSTRQMARRFEGGGG